MDSLSWIDSLPNKPSLARNQLILEAMQSGLATCQWSSVTSSYNNHVAFFQVCDDAVRVELENNYRFRFPVSATLAQQCADIMNVSLVTSKISDLSYQQAKIIENASLLSPGADMHTIDKSKQWNKIIETKRNFRNGLFRDCGKTWILSNKLTNSNSAINYGFYDKNSPHSNLKNIKMWQTKGTKHDRLHTDYSQVLIVMKKECEVDGKLMDVIDVMKNKDLCNLISDEGVLNFVRQPGI